MPGVFVALVIIGDQDGVIRTSKSIWMPPPTPTAGLSATESANLWIILTNDKYGLNVYADPVFDVGEYALSVFVGGTDYCNVQAICGDKGMRKLSCASLDYGHLDISQVSAQVRGRVASGVRKTTILSGRYGLCLRLAAVGTNRGGTGAAPVFGKTTILSRTLRSLLALGGGRNQPGRYWCRPGPFGSKNQRGVSRAAARLMCDRPLVTLPAQIGKIQRTALVYPSYRPLGGAQRYPLRISKEA